MRIGILSLAHHHAESYLALLPTLPGVQLAGLWDENSTRGRDAAQAHGIPLLATEAQLLAARLDGVVVASVNAEHRRFVELSASAGVHVLCEKPLATRLDDGRAMVDICAAAGVRLMTAFPMRWSPVVAAMAASLRAGTLGDPLVLEGINTGEMPDAHRAWFVDPALSGGGAIADHVVHLIDLYRWLLGQEVEEVYAVANRILHDGFRAVETGGLVSLRFVGGATATIDCSWSKPRSYPTWGGLRLEVTGTNGVIAIDAFGQHLTQYGPREVGIEWPFWGSDPNLAMLSEFVAAIREDREPAITGIDGLRALEVVEAAYRSIEQGVPVRLAMA
ncbi:MAG: Gfo/Idh/MocA family oxidoreductase [Chloroflexi bacterium]|nr:Gfo/Idh/MocA family oxidoreductase [Chloroflexota bacterium]